MPYIPAERREERFDEHLERILEGIEVQGDLTYCIYWLMVKWARSKPGRPSYHNYSPSGAACQDANSEFYRKEMIPLEDNAIERNGDI